jgi:ComF family protein
MTGLPGARHRFVAAVGRLGRWADSLRKSTLGVLYPPRCVCCDADLDSFAAEPTLCEVCQGSLAPAVWCGCRRCGGPVPEATPPQETCPYCRWESLEFEAAVTLGTYGGKLRDAVLKMKRPGAEPIAQAMGTFLCHRRGDQIRALCPKVVVPVPMHWMRRFVRKGNSPDVLATQVARFLQTPCQTRLLKRIRNTKPQKELTPSERRRNPVGAFGLSTAYHIRGARVLLVDDVLTTGATCSAAAKALKQAGAAAVVVAVLARAVGDSDA